jgi:hypothetical protein
MAIALGQPQAAHSAIAAPPTNQALQWASILVPGLTTIAGMRYNYLSQEVASNNAASVAISTNNTMAAISGQIQAPGAITTITDRHDTVTTLSGTGTLGSGDYITTPAPVVVPPVAPVVVVPDTVIAPPPAQVGP